MTLRRDHVAGGAFIVAGILVLAVSGDLPFGTLATGAIVPMPAASSLWLRRLPRSTFHSALR
jgi:hypothetical protein